MRVKKALLITGLACAALVLGMVFWPRAAREPKIFIGGTEAAQPVRPVQPADAKRPGSLSSPAGRSVHPVRAALNIPASSPLEGDDSMWQKSETPKLPRKVIGDAEALAKGGVLPAGGNTAPPASVAPTPTASALPGPATNRLQSLKAQDWNSNANRFLNALRAGQITGLDHAQVMDFLQGRDSQGWGESDRNWIGDELMDALRLGTPDQAFADLKTIQENPAAPAAMRDYSVQHIAELITSNVIGQAGVDHIWHALEQNDPATLSTALISLHRLSKGNPGLVDASRVTQAAQKLAGNPDIRTQMTAKAILKK